MFRDALTAVEQSTSLRVATSCEATEVNLYWLRVWADDSRRQFGARYGVRDAGFYGASVLVDGSAGADWCVRVTA